MKPKLGWPRLAARSLASLMAASIAACASARSTSDIVATPWVEHGDHSIYWHRVPIARHGAIVYIDACAPAGSANVVLLLDYAAPKSSGHATYMSSEERWSIDCTTRRGKGSPTIRYRGKMGRGDSTILVDDEIDLVSPYPSPEVSAICDYFGAKAELPSECGR
jgi:hypothetical protein